MHFETIAGGILIWRLRTEYNGADAKTVVRVERTASRFGKGHLVVAIRAMS